MRQVCRRSMPMDWRLVFTRIQTSFRSSEGQSSAPTVGTSGGAASSSGPLNASLFSVGFDATWEVDVFGGVRRSVEAAQANADAAVWQMRDGEVTLTAEIATDYLTLRATQERIAILREETQAQQDLHFMP